MLDSNEKYFKEKKKEIIKLRKKEKLKDYTKRINKTALYGRDLEDDEKVLKLKEKLDTGEISKKEYQKALELVPANLNIELKKNESFEKYVKKIEETAPFGYGPKGENNKKLVAHLLPMKYDNEVAWREGMGSDHGSFYNTGIGWRLNPTIFIILLFFVPPIILLPLMHLIFISYESFVATLIQELTINISFILLAIFLTLFTGYAVTRLEDLIKPFGKYHESIKMLFRDDLEYLKFSKELIWNVFDRKWLKIGLIGFLLYQPVGLAGIFIENIWKAGPHANLPHWCSLATIPGSIGLGLILLFILTFLVAIGAGLFKLAKLGSDNTKLSINKYGEMIYNIKEMVSTAHTDKSIKLKEMGRDLDATGRTYYEFQRGNRKIGEFLFNIATILISLTVTAGVLIWIIDALNLIPESLAANMMAITVAVTIFGIFSLGIFMLPQISIHLFLKQFKYDLIDNYSSLASRLEFIYFESLVKPNALEGFNDEWKSRADLLEDINLIKDIIKEVKGYGTWSYDFPEVLKLIIVVISTGIPLLLSFVDVTKIF
ncbi:MAG: hypothetical protein ACTSRI_04705 [Promethearchaeota archaeon]